MTDAFTELLSEYLDEELSLAERARVERHLQACVSCRDSLEGLRQVIGRAKVLPVDVPPNDLWPGIAARIVGPR